VCVSRYYDSVRTVKNFSKYSIHTHSLTYSHIHKHTLILTHTHTYIVWVCAGETKKNVNMMQKFIYLIYFKLRYFKRLFVIIVMIMAYRYENIYNILILNLGFS